MKAYKLIIITLFISVLILSMTGCEYDGPTAMYYKKHEQTTAPEITGIEPDTAAAGVNYITIIGKDFSDVLENNNVYIDGYHAEIVNYSTTSIRVRRPNIVADSTTVKVEKHEALEIAEYRPYKIDTVYSAYGKFVEGNQLSAVAINNAENLYVFQSSPRLVFKITPDGKKTPIAEPKGLTTGARGTVKDAKIGPGGKLILLVNNKSIFQMDLETGEDTATVWIELNKRVSYGDFDSYGNFYAGGQKSDLIVIAAGDTTGEPIGVYADDEILCVRVYNNYVYVLAENAEMAIWRHSVSSDGSVGTQEPVLNWSEAGDFAEYEPKYFTFSDDGIMYIGTDNTNPIMILNTDGSQDILYKGILPSSAEKLVWGNEDYLYMILGGDNWNLIRIDMGEKGASYSGRSLD